MARGCEQGENVRYASPTGKKTTFFLSIIALLFCLWKFLYRPSEFPPSDQKSSTNYSRAPQVDRTAPPADQRAHDTGESVTVEIESPRPPVEYTEAFLKKADTMKTVAPCSYANFLLKDARDGNRAMAQRFVAENNPQRLLACSQYFVQHAFYGKEYSDIVRGIITDSEVYDDFLSSIPTDVQTKPSFDAVDFVNLTNDYADIRVTSHLPPPADAFRMSYVVSWLKDDGDGVFHLAKIERE
jgi:hypothetical protein